MARTVSIDEPVEDDPYLEPDSGAAHGSGASPRTKPRATVKCVCCGESMILENLPRYNRGFGITLLVMGILLSLFMLILLGLPLVVIGAYLAVASKSVWACDECGAVVDRHAT